MKAISLCMPTNGISEWVFPALDSIYAQNIDESVFEVVVTDNGNNRDFEKKMRRYALAHSNVVYQKNASFLFDNQLEALKLAQGRYLKFVNHRSIWIEGRLQRMIDFIKDHEDTKPTIYFSNGALGWGPVFKEFDNFNSFVENLGHLASWTSGVGVWKEDFERIPANLQYDRISPHSSVLFSERKKEKYIIDDTLWMHDIESDHGKKGKYDLYRAFAVEELAITLKLYIDGDITADTLKAVKNKYGNFMKELYYDFNICKKPCSYDLKGFGSNMGIFFNRTDIVMGAFLVPFGRIYRKITCRAKRERWRKIVEGAGE